MTPTSARRAMSGMGCLLFGFFLGGGCMAESDEEKLAAPPNPAFRRPDFELFHSGRYVYERHCMICHGESGDGRGEMGLLLPVKPRSFIQGFFKYRSTPP